MKRNLLIMIFILLVIPSFVYGEDIDKDNISSGSYIIGGHLFNREINDKYNGTLTTKAIMLASRTLEDDKEIIYYKNSRGNYINAIDGSVIENVPDKFNIICKNLDCAISSNSTSTEVSINYNKDEIDGGTYLIGTYLFDRNTNENYNGVLTTKLIMRAAKTIEGNTLDDMVIYYKNSRGNYINAINGEVLQEVKESFKITSQNLIQVKAAIDINTLDIEYPDNFEYDGNEKMPVVTIKDNDKTLTLDTDYKVNYKNNINAGNGEITITGINDYTGTVNKTFIINRKKIEIPTIDDKVYNGKLQIGVITSDFYTIAGSNEEINAGTYKITVTTDNNHIWIDDTTTKSIEWKILPKEITLSWQDEEFIYNGDSQAPTPIGNTSIDEEEVVLTRTTNVNAGTYITTATISKIIGGEGNKYNYTLINNKLEYTIKKATPILTLSKNKDTIYHDEISKFTISSNITGSFTLTSSNEEIAILENTIYNDIEKDTLLDVKVNAIKEGNINITIKFIPTDSINYDVVEDTYNLMVNTKIYVSDIILDKTDISFIGIDNTDTITASVVPNDATDKTLIYLSSDSNIVTVDNGVVIPKNKGEATITIKDTSGKVDKQVKVRVYEKITSLNLLDENEIIDMNMGSCLTLMVIKEPISADEELIWTSSDTSVATVKDGEITAVGAGTTIITVSNQDGTISKSCTIKIKMDLEYMSKAVGINYSTWFNIATLGTIDENESTNYYYYKNRDENGYFYNITDILRGYQDYGKVSDYHFWNRPAVGYYYLDGKHYVETSKNVVKTHMRQLEEAGVDFIILDNTNVRPDWGDKNDKMSGWNLFVYEPETFVLGVIKEMRDNGEATPYVVNWIYETAKVSESTIMDKSVLEHIYEEFYLNEDYEDLWVYWDSLPFILGTQSTTSADEISYNGTLMNNLISYRKMWGKKDYLTGNDLYEENEWSFLEDNNGNLNNSGEQVSVAPAIQHPYMSDATTAIGRRDGCTFYEQWYTVFKKQPKIVTITEWNEWIAQKQSDVISQAFVDNYNAEYSRDIEPASGELGTSYYNYMKEYINAYKNDLDIPDIKTVTNVENYTSCMLRPDGFSLNIN